ncbi:LacI family DNA-binding transcriptional regulator [Gracilibacillus alcaliphilus]|uniref:LacI family DNA-binding transcriptional regulator n=1 Tax=Gracilibacillus alcaliphilus TaxID=1401441 RepID=UPI00195CEC25|nr:LacI family DNA-binding transcriptional regulator [Gracilibacillus alcaliphilus]MBM7677481.1 LacI family transcriptional regulator [Gracilibacillus alcaliphilus]
MVTIYDIAKYANVSPMTVSRVINNSINIKATTREKVERAIKELGYIPNAAARSLTSNQTKTLGLILTDITNPYFSKIARGVEDVAVEKGYRVLISNTDEDSDKEVNYIDMMISARVDGVLITPTSDKTIDQVERLRKHNIQVVLLDRTIEGFEGDYVIGDSYLGTQQLVQHLIDYGHQNIALINGPANVSTARERARGYLETLKQNGLEVYEHYLSELDYKHAQEGKAKEILKRLLSLEADKCPTAIFAANNFIAVSAIRSLRELGLSVPDDISVVCFDEVEPIVYFDPFFTVAAQPAIEFGRVGIQLLIERVEEKEAGIRQQVILPPVIHIRKSTMKRS